MVDARRPPEVDRAAASRRAVEARRERAALKRDVSSRVISPQELLRRGLADPLSPAGAMRVTEFLTAIPAIGESKRDRILVALGISPVKRLGGLGTRQRDALRAFLDTAGPSRVPATGAADSSCSPGPRRSQGHRGRAHQAALPQIHLSVSATTRSPAPARSTASTTTSSTTPSSTAWSPRGSCWSGPSCTTRTVTARLANPSSAFSPRAAPPCSRSTCRGPDRYAPPTPRRRWCSCCRRAGTSSSNASSDGGRGCRGARPTSAHARVELAAQNEFDYRVVNEDVASAAAEVVALAAAQR